MPNLLVLEDDLNQARMAADMAHKAGFIEVQALASAKLAQIQLENAIEDHTPLPDAIVLDLDLGTESGFELLRFCHRNRLLQQIRIVVWTVMGEHEREICRLFGVSEFVSKQDGASALLEVLNRINRRNPDSAANA